MILGVLKETRPGENRVALTPDSVALLTKKGHTVLVEAGAGVAAGYPDSSYAAKSATIASREDLFVQAGLLLQVQGLGGNPHAEQEDLGRLRSGQGLVAMLDPLSHPEAVVELAGRGVTSFALELIPRITRAQTMDVLSSMATVAGYKAVLIAASRLTRMMPLLMTAAGTIQPAKVFVIGAGVAGLQAIATARRLGAVVKAYDVRPAAKEQILSLGGRPVEIDIHSGEGQGGYARELSAEEIALQQERMGAVIAESDIVVSTAAVPGRKAPVLITGPMVDGMSPGSVIIDLAAERGGNCAYTKPGEVIEVNGVTIVGTFNIPSTVPFHASQMFSKNVATFVLHLLDSHAKNGADGLWFDRHDEIVSGTLVSLGGQVVHPVLQSRLESPSSTQA